MDCPWCGCGWLFSCITCRKAFTFAIAVEVEQSWDELARQDILGQFGEEKPDLVNDWVEEMQDILEGIKPGEEYVIFDGIVVPTDVAGLEYTGWHAQHNLDFVPQVEAMSNESVMDSILCSNQYWEDNAVPECEDEA